MPLAFLALRDALAASPAAPIARAEIAIDPDDTWVVEPLGPDGVVARGMSHPTDAGAPIVSLERYDADLHPIWTITHEVPRGSRLGSLVVDGESVWFTVSRSYRTPKFTLVAVSLADGRWEEHPIRTPERGQVRGLALNQGTAWLMFARSAAHRQVLTVDLTAGTAVPLDLPAVDHAESAWFVHDARPVTVLARSEERGHAVLTAIELPAATVTRATTPDDTNLLDVDLVVVGGERRFVGTFSDGARARRPSGLADGLVTADGSVEWRYTRFAAFTHLLDVLPPTVRDNVTAGRAVAPAFRLLPQVPIASGNQAVWVATMCEPRTEDAPGARISWCAPVAVVVAALGSDGALEWDSAAPVTSHEGPRQVGVLLEGAHYTAVYVERGRVFTLSADGRGPRRLDTRDIVAGGVHQAWAGRAAAWYDHYFLLTDYEDLGEGRTVYALTKVGPG